MLKNFLFFMQHIKETLAYIDAINLALSGNCALDPENFEESLSHVLPRLQALESLDSVALFDEAKDSANMGRLRIALNTEPRCRFFDRKDEFLRNPQTHINAVKWMSQHFRAEAEKAGSWNREQQIEYLSGVVYYVEVRLGVLLFPPTWQNITFVSVVVLCSGLFITWLASMIAPPIRNTAVPALPSPHGS